MECRNQQVVHKRFGQGSIQSIEGGVIHIYFQQYGARAFRYPEAFEGFLKAEDAEFAAFVQTDLDRWKDEQRTRDAEIQLKVEAEIGEARMARKRTTTTKSTSSAATGARRTPRKTAAK